MRCTAVWLVMLALSTAAPARAAGGMPGKLGLEAGWWHPIPGSSYGQRWDGGPAFGLDWELREGAGLPFVRLEYATLAPDEAAVSRYYNGALVAAEGRATLAGARLGWRHRVLERGGDGVSFELGLGVNRVHEPRFSYAYPPPIGETYYISEKRYWGLMFEAGGAMDVRVAPGRFAYVAARLGGIVMNDPVTTLNLRLGLRFD